MLGVGVGEGTMLFLKVEVYLSRSGGQGDPGQGAPSVQPYLRLARAGPHSSDTEKSVL